MVNRAFASLTRGRVAAEFARSMKGKNSSSRRGVLAGGNWIIDQVKLVDVFPQRESLANIRRQARMCTSAVGVRTPSRSKRTASN